MLRRNMTKNGARLMQRSRIGVYPGTFDPIHKGHLDVIRRASLIVDQLIVAVAINAGKDPMFSLEQRTRMVQADIDTLAAANATNGTRIEVKPFQTLLVQFAAENGADLIIRGLRAVSDFEYEFQMAANNKRLSERTETVFLMASETNQFISSRFVKEINFLGGDVSSFVSDFVLRELHLNRPNRSKRISD